MFKKPTDEEIANKFNYHAPKDDQAARYEAIRAHIRDTALVCVQLSPCSPEQTRALNKLHEAMMLFNAAIACNE